MSHSTPEPPSLCHLPCIKAQMPGQMAHTVEPIIEVTSFLPPEYIEDEQVASIGHARKRAVAVLLVLTNLVPVCLPTLDFKPLLMPFKDDFIRSWYRRWTHHRRISSCGWTKSSSMDPSIILVRIPPSTIGACQLTSCNPSV